MPLRRDEEHHRPNPQYPYTTQEDRVRHPAAHNVDRPSSGLPPDRAGLSQDPSFYVDKPGPGYWRTSYHADQMLRRSADYYPPLDHEVLNAYDRQVLDTDAARSFRDPQPEQGQTHRGRGPLAYRRIDKRVFEDVCDSLAHDPDVDASDIEVQVEDGVVHLVGTVRSRYQKRRAEIACDNVPGVRDVMNELRIVG